MGYLPLLVDLEGRECLVIGGDWLAEGRVKALREAGAAVTVVAAEITPQLGVLVQAGTISYRARDYATGDLRGQFMAWVATMDEAIGRAAAAEARQRGIMINVTDRPALCDFIMPAVVKRGTVQVAISTGGASPALARRIREQLEELIGPEYGPFAEMLRSARRWLKGQVGDAGERARLLSRLVAPDLIEAFRRGEWEKVESLMRTHLGAGFDEIGFEAQAVNTSEIAAISPN
jgi:precorrin-2 dehydrogenase / sirohydrochlorin ferrochelatase